MKAVPRRVLFALVLVIAARLVHGACGEVLAERDPIAAVLAADLPIVLAAVALVVSRLFLYLLAPGWALYLLLRALLERRQRATKAAGMSG